MPAMELALWWGEGTEWSCTAPATGHLLPDQGTGSMGGTRVLGVTAGGTPHVAGTNWHRRLRALLAETIRSAGQTPELQDGCPGQPKPPPLWHRGPLHLAQPHDASLDPGTALRAGGDSNFLHYLPVSCFFRGTGTTFLLLLSPDLFLSFSF